MKKQGHKDIFIFIAGSTPQVITETVYSLAIKDPPVYPDEIYIITTEKGKGIVIDALIKKGHLQRLIDEYSLPAINLQDISFVIPMDASGSLLEDIRDFNENEIMGDLITSFIREKAKDSSAALHCSIAGGRKTMSFYLGSALQLFGRPWDKLYHVLVTPEFENHPDFFYKPKEERNLTPLNPPLDKGGNGELSDKVGEEGLKRVRANGRSPLLNTKDAQINLAELPFIRLREKLSLQGKGFRELVAEGQKDIDIAAIQPEVRINLSKRAVSIGNKSIRLTPLHLMIYTAYLRQKLNRCRFPERQYCLDCTECFPSLLELATKPALEDMAKDYIKICPPKVDDLLNKYKEGLSIETIRQAISKIKKAFSNELADETISACYSITTSLREYSNTRHGVRVEKGKIRIE
ncbi:MAG: CRISPR-associated ring nuclease Csm6 [Nitrospirota bacterium]